MKIKQIPQDFIVKEIIDIPKLKKDGEYTYFWLEKTNWTTTRALEKIARLCKTSRKRFNFSGTKDKNALTKQVCCAWKVSPETLKSINLKDIKIKVIGKGNEKINLGSHEKNNFKITIRDLTSEEIPKIKQDIIFPNYFGLQRFGSSGNSHKIGILILKGTFQKAAKEILTNLGEKNKEAAKFVKENWGSWKKIIKIIPPYLSPEKSIVNHLIKTPTDFAGSIRTLHKKIRMLFVSAVQSYIFNLTLSELIKENLDYAEIKFLDTKLALPTLESQKDIPKDFINKEIELAGFDATLNKTSAKILKSLDLKPDDFKSKRMPELARKGDKRIAFIKTKINASKPKSDELNKNKKKITLSFDLPKGAYATTLINIIFYKNIKTML